MRKGFNLLFLVFICLLLIDQIECRRELRNLKISRTRRSSTARTTTSRSYQAGGSMSTTGIIIICVVVPLVFFVIFFFIARACRKNQQNKVAVQNAGLTSAVNLNQSNINKEMEKSNLAGDPYFQNQNQQQMMYPIQNNMQQPIQQQPHGMLQPQYLQYSNNVTYNPQIQQQLVYGQPVIQKATVL